jgi:hypothetical protein
LWSTRTPQRWHWPAKTGSFSPRDERVLDEIRALDVERMTPMDALNALARLAARLKKEG